MEKTKLEIVGPESVFRYQAAQLFQTIRELQLHPLGAKQAYKAREHLEKALAHLERAFEKAR